MFSIKIYPDSSGMVLVDASGRTREPKSSKINIAAIGLLRSTIYIEGSFSLPAERQPLAGFFSRLDFFSGFSSVQMEFTIRNPRAAKHTGGLWDLGDPGSIFFKDLSLQLRLAGESRGEVLWSETPQAALKQAAHGSLEIYQDSSGGQNWQSRNHVNRLGKVMHSFRGYRVRSAGWASLARYRLFPATFAD